MGCCSDVVAVDSTGMESTNASTFFGRRCGRRYTRYPKLSAVVDVKTHLFLGVVIDRGPKPDDTEFHRLARQAHRRQRFRFLLADAGYDGENHHRFLYGQLGVLGVIPPMRGRPGRRADHVPVGLFRAALASRWPIKAYRQRWQVETVFSLLKRLLGSAVRCRTRHAIDREIFLRILTLNLMILWRLIPCFQQSSSFGNFDVFARATPPGNWRVARLACQAVLPREDRLPATCGTRRSWVAR